MFKSISNIKAAVSDLATIAGKEVSYQITHAVKSTGDATSYFAAKTQSLREQYEQNLNNRKNRNPEVVTDAPSDVTHLN